MTGREMDAEVMQREGGLCSALHPVSLSPSQKIAGNNRLPYEGERVFEYAFIVD